MVRSPVHVRDASADDAAALVEVWRSFSDRSPERTAGSDGERPVEVVTGGAALDQAESSIARLADNPDQRLLVATIDDHVVGAVYLERRHLSPIHAESAIFVIHLHVVDEFRRHGVGRALLEATVTWAEEKDASHVIAAAAVASRDANRFMARLGLGQVAVVRGATVAALRAKLPVDPPAAARVGSRSHRNVGQVLVQRRSMRRARTRMS